MQMLLNQLKAQNPQKYQMISQAISNKDNPMELFRNITNGYDEATRKKFFQQAEQIGFSKEYLDDIQNKL